MQPFYPYSTSWSRVDKVYPKPPSLFSIGVVFSDEQGMWLELSTRIKWFSPISGETLVAYPGVKVKVNGTSDEPRVLLTSDLSKSFPVCKTWEVWTERINFAPFDSTGLRECDLITFAKRKRVMDPLKIEELKREIGCKSLSKFLYEMICLPS
jgi:hypothetical protein